MLPKETWKGQVDWYLANPNTGRGRILQSSRENAMALDFSCGVNINLCQLQFSGTLLEISDGQTVDFGSINPYVCMNSCSGTPAGGGCTGCTYGWDSQAPSIANISGSSSTQSVSLYGAAPGSTYVDAFASGMGCYVQVSPSPPVTVQIPKNTRVVRTVVNQLNSACAPGYSGWDREVYRAVIDQNGADIKQSGQSLEESVSITANGLNLGPFNTSPASTDSNGQFYDTFKACSALCPASSNTTTASQTITDTFNGVYTLTPATLQFACGNIKVNGALTP
jgi:hypothetical protein